MDCNRGDDSKSHSDEALLAVHDQSLKVDIKISGHQSTECSRQWKVRISRSVITLDDCLGTKYYLIDPDRCWQAKIAGFHHRRGVASLLLTCYRSVALSASRPLVSRADSAKP